MAIEAPQVRARRRLMLLFYGALGVSIVAFLCILAPLREGEGPKALLWIVILLLGMYGVFWSHKRLKRIEAEVTLYFADFLAETHRHPAPRQQ